MKFKLYILLLLCFATLAVSAQKVTFKGRITDENGSPIEIANVKVVGEPVGTVADLNGRYSLTCDSRDSLVLSFSMVGYQTRKRGFKNPVDTIILNVKLPSLDYSLQAVEVVDKKTPVRLNSAGVFLFCKKLNFIFRRALQKYRRHPWRSWRAGQNPMHCRNTPVRHYIAIPG